MPPCSHLVMKMTMKVNNISYGCLFYIVQSGASGTSQNGTSVQMSRSQDVYSFLHFVFTVEDVVPMYSCCN
jgi:hypothetical protein